MTHAPPSPALSAFSTEMERLCLRPAQSAEERVAQLVLNGRSAWVDGLRPDCLAHFALAFANGAGRSVLFVSPSRGTWEDRKLRLAPRGPWYSVDRSIKTQVMRQRSVVSVTPDTLSSPAVARALGPEGPDLIVIEHAHALSSHSGSYRPSLARVSTWLRRFPQAKVVCCTTASTHALRQEIAGVLGRYDLEDSETHVQIDFLGEPQSIRLQVENHPGAPPTTRIAELPRPAVVLCATPAQADETYAALTALKVPTHRYHAGLSASERAKELLHFALPGRRAVLVAMSAFGPSSGFEGWCSTIIPDEFGRDYLRRDVRSVVHLCAPCSLRQYANELSLLTPNSSGLAATNEDEQLDDERDGEPATALLFYDSAHLMLNLALQQRKRPHSETLEVLVDTLLTEVPPQGIESDALISKVGGSPRELDECIRFLEDAAVVERHGSILKVAGERTSVRRIAEELAAHLDNLREGDTQRLEEVESYARAQGCRRTLLLEQLGFVTGGTQSDSCGSCDICAAITPSTSMPVDQRARGGPNEQLEEHEREGAVRRQPVISSDASAKNASASSKASAKKTSTSSSASAKKTSTRKASTKKLASNEVRAQVPLRPLARARARSL